MENKAIEQLISYIDALYPIIYINHFDFKRIDDIIKNISDDRKIIEFNNGLGMVDFEDKSLLTECNLSDFLKLVKDEGFKDNLFIILKDIHSQLDDLEIISLLKYIAYKNLYDEGYNSSIFIVSSKLYIPKELENFITVFHLPLPEVKEIRSTINNFIRGLDIEIFNGKIEQIARLFNGLDEFQIKQILNLFYLNGGRLDFNDKHLIFKQKEALINKTGLLEMITEPESLDDVGGLENLKGWLYKKKYIFDQLDKAIKFGIDAPRGIMITGMPKCGKSLAARAAANLFEIPLLKMDINKFLGKCINKSEENMQKALKLAETFSPCVLWIDEIEKAFWGAEIPNEETSVVKCLFNQFLTWMQEKENLVFVAATVNDISKIPSELLKKKCFDEVFYADFPNNEERKKIIEIHLKKCNKWNGDLDLISLVRLTDQYSGSDLEDIVKKAVENCFIEGKETLTTEDLKNAQKTINPVSEFLQVKIRENKEMYNYIDLLPANSAENKLAEKPWLTGNDKENKNIFVDPTAVTLYEILGKGWWKKPYAKFIDKVKQKNFSIESSSWGYGIGLI